MKKSELKRLIKECIVELHESAHMTSANIKIPIEDDDVDCEVEFEYDAPYRATHSDPGQGWVIYIYKITRLDTNTEIDVKTLDKRIQSVIEDDCAEYMEDLSSGQYDDPDRDRF